jgi:hypothetical protein
MIYNFIVKIMIVHIMEKKTVKLSYELLILIFLISFNIYMKPKDLIIVENYCFINMSPPDVVCILQIIY